VTVNIIFVLTSNSEKAMELPGNPDPSVVISRAVNGTLNILRAAHSVGITRVTITSSMAAAILGQYGGPQVEIGPGQYTLFEPFSVPIS